MALSKEEKEYILKLKQAGLDNPWGILRWLRDKTDISLYAANKFLEEECQEC